NGNYCTQSSGARVCLRDWYLWLIQLVPSWKHWLQLGNRRDGMVKYQWQDGTGMAFLHKLGGGQNFPQVYAVRVGSDQPPQCGQVLFTDDIIFGPQKQGLFQVVVILQPHSDPINVKVELYSLEEASSGALKDGEATCFLNSTQTPPLESKRRDIYRIATAAEFAADPILCGGRPEPKGYDPYRMSEAVGNKKFVILRPDRFVYAVCDTRAELLFAAQTLRSLVTRGIL
ncbi:hypothetical protein NKR19_g1, partial [Coniochaeta hoffmannii]